MPPFTISAAATRIDADPAAWGAEFAERRSCRFEGVFEPEFLGKMLERAAAATYEDNDVERIGLREVEVPQRVGGTLSLVLGRHGFLEWLSAVTGAAPLRAISGRLVQTRANGIDSLAWHDDLVDGRRLLGLVVNLSDRSYEGGAFELRRKKDRAPLRTVAGGNPGDITVFAVDPAIEHRVTGLLSGGPRRVYAGWAMTEPEHAGDPLAIRA